MSRKTYSRSYKELRKAQYMEFKKVVDYAMRDYAYNFADFMVKKYKEAMNKYYAFPKGFMYERTFQFRDKGYQRVVRRSGSNAANRLTADFTGGILLHGNEDMTGDHIFYPNTKRSSQEIYEHNLFEGTHGKPTAKTIPAPYDFLVEHRRKFKNRITDAGLQKKFQRAIKKSGFKWRW